MEEVIRLFNTNGVRYILIGGQAVRLAGMPRFSLDWDFLIPPHDAENIDRINELLGADLDIELVPLGPRGENFVQTYQTKYGVMQFHLGAVGLSQYDEVEKRSIMLRDENGVEVRCLSVQDLIAVKRKVGRPKDIEDADFLERKLKAAK